MILVSSSQIENAVVSRLDHGELPLAGESIVLKWGPITAQTSPQYPLANLSNHRTADTVHLAQLFCGF